MDFAARSCNVENVKVRTRFTIIFAAFSVGTNEMKTLEMY